MPVFPIPMTYEAPVNGLLRPVMPGSDAPRLPRNLMLALSLVQGLALLWLWRALDEGTWPSGTPMVNFPLWTVALAWPTLLLMSLETDHRARVFQSVSAFCAVLALLAVYIGRQASPADEFPVGSLVAIYAATMLVACFKALMYVPRWSGRAPAGYDALFTLSWRNFLVAAHAAALTCGVYAVLHLWGRLFSAIGIGFFEDLFGRDWFLFPVLAVAFGLGVSIFRRLVDLIDGITGLLEGLMRLLLPLAVGVAVIFLAALPFTGLGPLWGTGSGTELLLWLSAFVLFFVNAVYQTGRGAPYPPVVHRVLRPGIVLLPALSALALYGLHLRVDQYGWSVERCWAFTVGVLLAAFSTGYAGCIIRRRGDWPQDLGRVNKVLGWALLAVMLLVNSPVLDFRKISLASQLRRVDTGEIELRDFDFHYAREHLARPAWTTMQAFIDAHEESDPDLARLIREPAPIALPPPSASDLWEGVTYRPEPFEAPAGAREAIERFFFGPHPDPPADAHVRHPLPPPHQYGEPVLIRVDLDADGEPEYVYVVVDPDRAYVSGVGVYREGGDRWRSFVLAMREPMREQADPAEILREGEIEAVAPRFRDLRIGELVLGGW